MSVFFVTGIDTDIGKSYATGLIGRYLLSCGVNVITQKLVQTGQDAGIAQDILIHRRLMGIDIQECDRIGTTCRQTFKYPASPHLAAEMENSVIDSNAITEATEDLQRQYDTVLLEGAGGLAVPLCREFLTTDYLETLKYPLIIVSSGKLGSINHTLLTLESAVQRNIPICGIVYNHYIPAEEPIRHDTIEVLKYYLARYGRLDAIAEIPEVAPDGAVIDFAPLFKGLGI